MTEKTIKSVSSSSIVFIAISVIILLIVFSFWISHYIYIDYKESYKNEAILEINSEFELVEKVINDFQNQALSVALSISSMDLVREAYYEEDSLEAIAVLNREIQPFISQIKHYLNYDKYKIHFHKAPAKSFLRLWNQTGGDDLSGFRNTILHVHSTQKALKCLEFGRGGFAIRGIAPIFSLDNKYVGSVEVFFEIQDVFPYLISKYNEYNFIVLADKQQFDNLFFQQEKEKYFLGQNENHVIIANTLDEKYNIDHILNLINFDDDTKSLEYEELLLSFHHIKDFTDTNVGELILCYDRTPLLEKASSRIKMMIFLFGIFGLISVALLVFLIQRISQKAQRDQKLLLISLKEAEEAKFRAEEADRSKSEFLANMSHEIRTPLNAILGYSEILSSKLKEKDSLGYLDGISVSGRSLLGIINDILDLSKIEAGRIELDMKAFNFYKLIDDIKKVFELRMQAKELSFNLDIDENLPKSIIADAPRLRQVLFNLIGNAVKFTDQGGISIKVRSVEQINEYSVSTVNLIIEVSDTGIGIPEDQINTIFEAFKQQKDQSIGKFGGTGLGLTISKRLIEMMNGSISVKSHVGKGSTFTIHLNELNVSSVVIDDEHQEYDQSIKLTGGTILLVEDVESNRKVVKGFLEDFPLTILSAENGKIGVDMAIQHLPDVILMDIHMPVMNGFDASVKVKQDPKTEHIPIIALTASVFKHQEKELKALCDGYLRKPVSKQILIKELSKYLNSETKAISSASVARKKELPPHDKFLNELVNANLKDRFVELFNEDYTIISKSMSINAIKKWSLTLNKFSDENKLEYCKSLSSSLLSACETFDIKKIKLMLSIFKVIQ